MSLVRGLANPGEEPGHERGAVGKGLEFHVFVKRVRAITNRTEPV